MRAERFLILPHPQVADYFMRMLWECSSWWRLKAAWSAVHWPFARPSGRRAIGPRRRRGVFCRIGRSAAAVLSFRPKGAVPAPPDGPGTRAAPYSRCMRGADDGDLGLFGPGSVAWRIHADPAALLGGMRALLVQALNPRAMAAMAQHSDYRADPWGRLRRTAEYLVDTIYGTRAQAEMAAGRVRAVHRRVQGVDPVTGRAYRADDPDLLLWIHAVEVDSFLTAYRAYAGRLSDGDADRYVAEMVSAAELVGLPAEGVPRDVASLREYLDSFAGLALTPAAREGMRVVLSPPMPAALRPLWTIPAVAAVAILPPPVRDLYGLPWPPPATPLVRVAVWGLLRALNVARKPPPPIRRALDLSATPTGPLP